MKPFVVLCVIAFIVIASAEDCKKEEFLHVQECGPLVLEPTCDNPKGHKLDDVPICDYSSCFCNPPNVREITSGRCVPVEKCPTTDFAEWFKYREKMKAEAANKVGNQKKD